MAFIPGLDFSDIIASATIYETDAPGRCLLASRMPESWFSASAVPIKDAIRKSWAAQKPDAMWDVLYIRSIPATSAAAIRRSSGLTRSRAKAVLLTVGARIWLSAT